MKKFIKEKLRTAIEMEARKVVNGDLSREIYTLQLSADLLNLIPEEEDIELQTCNPPGWANITIGENQRTRVCYFFPDRRQAELSNLADGPPHYRTAPCPKTSDSADYYTARYHCNIKITLPKDSDGDLEDFRDENE